MSRFVPTAVVLVALLAAAPVIAGPYSPDPAFGDHGVILGPAAQWNDLVAMGDGRVLVGGDVGNVQDLPLRVALGRFLSDGSPDPTFGGGDGYVETVVGDGSSVAALALQGDGKIVAAAWGGDDIQEDVVVLRYMADGTVVPGFGTGGIVQTNIGGRDFGADVVIQPDGRIVVVGVTETAGLVVARYLTDGTPDASFDGDGIATITNPPAAGASGVVLQPDGRIVVVGTQGNVTPQVFVARLLTGGGLDPTFGAGGIVLTSVTASFDSATAVALLPDGRLYVAGFAGANTPGSSWFLIRYLDTGALDGGFGTGGIVTTPMPGNALARDLALQADGRVVIAGQSYAYEFPIGYRLAIIRYLTDGSIDPSLGTVATLAGVNSGASQGFHAVAIAADGDIVAAGHSYPTNQGSDSVIVRYGTPFPVCWDGVVDAPEQCDDRNYLDGDCCTSTCQLDGPEVACAADTDPCTTDVCDGAGLCAHDPGNDGASCDDGEACTTDACQGGACVGTAEPQPSCKAPVAPTRGLLFVSASRDKLTWNWLRGEETTSFLRQGYKLCIYDQSGGTQPVTQLETLCLTDDCWTFKGQQPIYVQNAGMHDGITRMSFTPGADGKARIQFRARGANLPQTPLPLVTPVTVQLHGLGDGQCWTATYGSVRRNDANTFRASPD